MCIHCWHVLYKYMSTYFKATCLFHYYRLVSLLEKICKTVQMLCPHFVLISLTTITCLLYEPLVPRLMPALQCSCHLHGSVPALPRSSHWCFSWADTVIFPYSLLLHPPPLLIWFSLMWELFINLLRRMFLWHPCCDSRGLVAPTMVCLVLKKVTKLNFLTNLTWLFQRINLKWKLMCVHFLTRQRKYASYN